MQGSASTQASKFSQMPGRTNHVNLRWCIIMRYVHFSVFVNVSNSLFQHKAASSRRRRWLPAPLSTKRRPRSTWLIWDGQCAPDRARLGWTLLRAKPRRHQQQRIGRLAEHACVGHFSLGVIRPFGFLFAPVELRLCS